MAKLFSNFAIFFTQDMKTIISDPTLITKEVVSSDGTRHFVIKNTLESGDPTKLGHVFRFLPPGILHKEETGIGATTLELESKRNSIVVEPLRSTALTKSQKSPDYFFVGTRPDGSIATAEEIREYVKGREHVGKPVKFICVADSLNRVIEALGQKKIKDDGFHLLIDESDSFQTSASYRRSMEKALDYYKDVFEPRNRSMVTATPLVFTDPKLSSEQKTKFSYSSPVRRPLTLVETTNVAGAIYEKIVDHFSDPSAGKLVVALNNATKIRDLADMLVVNKILDQNDIRVLCGKGSVDKVKKYYHELMDSMLPVKLVFKTSAYFVGYDIEEPYHLLIGVAYGKIMQLSELTIKQIVGRARTGLHSVTVIAQKNPLPLSNRLDFDDILEIANHQLDGYRCLIINFEKSKHLLDEVKVMKEKIEKAMKFRGYSYIREDFQGKPQISYLNIDGYLEETRIRERIFAVAGGLKMALEEAGFDVSTVDMVSTKRISQSNEQIQEQKKIREIAERTLPGSAGKWDPAILKNPVPFKRLEHAYGIYDRYQAYVDPDFLREQILLKLDSVNESGSKRSLNKLDSLLYFHVLDPSTPLKGHIFSKVEVGKRYSKGSLLSIANDALAIAGIYTPYPDYSQARKMLGVFFEIESDGRPRKNPKTEARDQKIVSLRKIKDGAGNSIEFPKPVKFLPISKEKFRADMWFKK
ncbi:hypothetical protein C943_04177 [Mariniradius saccharolyticus AK6]|uniref:Uncharacterized protein n=2 Tax=Mariniradius TaxID=1245590 RepID=M7XH48_9BACT|nr:hypothetical protein C943_04177 [Mariniradius saccharolyticus AK6]